VLGYPTSTWIAWNSSTHDFFAFDHYTSSTVLTPQLLTSTLTFNAQQTGDSTYNPLFLTGTYTNVDTYNRIQFSIFDYYQGEYLPTETYSIPLQNGVGLQYFKWFTAPSVGYYDIRARLYDTETGSTTAFTSIQTYYLASTSATSLNASTTETIGRKDGLTISSTTVSYVSSDACYPFSGQFDTLDCIYYLFVPQEDDIAIAFQDLKDNVLTVFPIGYITDFVTILSTTSAVTIPVVSATTTAGLGTAGAVINLSITSSTLSWLWNATSTGKYGTASTTTLYQFVEGYWEKVLWLSVFIYIFYRITGLSVKNKQHYDN
jgi:hypothetical protein